MKTSSLLFLLASCLVYAATASGCSFGPRALERVHGQYNEAVKDVYEEQFLLNVVRLRYNDNPTRLDVSSIAAQYELSGMAQAQPFFMVAAATELIQSFTRILPAAQILGADRPTVSLNPVDDKETVQRFLTPMEPETVLFCVQSGWPISTIFRLFVNSINGVPNAPGATGPVRDVPVDFERFQHLVQQLQVVQDHDYVRVVPEKKLVSVGSPVKLKEDGVNLVEAAKAGYFYQNPGGKDHLWVLKKRERTLAIWVKPDAVGSPVIVQLANLLHLQPDLRKYEITTSPPDDPYEAQTREGLTEIRIVPRSTIQTMFYLARGVEVPPEHLGCGVAGAVSGPEGGAVDSLELTRGLFTVHCCKQACRPRHAQVAVKYRGYWFYIDDRDQESKATLVLMLHLVRLNLTPKRGSDTSAAPQLTLPVGR